MKLVVCFWLVIVYSFLPFLLSAQTGGKIITLERPHLDTMAEAQKETLIDTAGNVISWTYLFAPDDRINNQGSFIYDEKGRLIESEEQVYVNYTKSTFTYGENEVVERRHYNGKDYVIYQFFNEKGQLTEEKTYLKEQREDNLKLTLTSRNSYSYDARDSLEQETYHISTYEPVDQLERKQHFYAPETGLKQKAIEYKGKKAIGFWGYEYNALGQLIYESYENRNHGHAWRYIYYEYKLGKLFKKEIRDIYSRTIEIYKNGQIIRRVIYPANADGHSRATAVWDFQYID